MMTLLDILGKIAWVRYDFLSQGKISDTLFRCARIPVSHLNVLHCSSSVRQPAKLATTSESGNLASLVLCLCPPPQVRLQGPQGPHRDQNVVLPVKIRR